MELTEERRLIDLEEQIRRMKAQASHRREHDRKTSGWMLVLIAFGTIIVIIAGWATGFASTAASLRTP